MQCECGGDTLVRDSRQAHPRVIRRKRVCLRCGSSFTTYESRQKPTVLARDPAEDAARKRERRKNDPEAHRPKYIRANRRKKARETATLTARPVEEMYRLFNCE
jgi:transcriptional regulator NrdR family protein